MVEIENKILSLDVFEKYFMCDLQACFGECCIDGDSGAPLELKELKEVENAFPVVKKYLDKKHLKVIEEQGVYLLDEDEDYVTPCYKSSECAYTYFENNIAKCVFELAYNKGEIAFKKPISCHLYPIRIVKYEEFEAINYQKRKICKAARVCGIKHQTPVYQFLKEPLVRMYGNDWYEKVETAAKILKSKNIEE